MCNNWLITCFFCLFLINVFFNQRIIALLNFVGFCQISTWLSHRYAYVPSVLNLPPASHPSHHCRWSQSPSWSSPNHTANFPLAVYFTQGNVYARNALFILPPWSTEFIPECELRFLNNLLKPCSDLAHQTLVKRDSLLVWRKCQETHGWLPANTRLKGVSLQPWMKLPDCFCLNQLWGQELLRNPKARCCRSSLKLSNKFLFLKKDVIYSFVLFGSF